VKLYGYFRSSAAYRVRIALNLKAIEVDHLAVHLLKDGGQQRLPEYAKVNPQAIVPTLELDDGRRITQSLAIIEYLDDVFPDPKLVPSEPFEAALTRAVALAISCDIHPISNLRILRYLKTELRHDQVETDAWYKHWTRVGLEAVDELISGGDFCFSDRPTIADCCLIPQLFNARRFSVPIDDLQKILRVENTCEKIAAFVAAHPSRQPDAE
jgi:maleylacetoacetate isomerase